MIPLPTARGKKEVFGLFGQELAVVRFVNGVGVVALVDPAESPSAFLLIASFIMRILSKFSSALFNLSTSTVMMTVNGPFKLGLPCMSIGSREGASAAWC